MFMPMIQFSSRGRAESAGEEDPAMWTTIAPTKMFAAQWCIWRMSRPARTLKLRLTRREVRLRHVHAVERQVRPVVDDVGRRGHEVQREEDAGGEQDDEGVEGDLADHEGPVVGEDLVEHLPAAAGDAGGCRSSRRGRQSRAPPEARTDGLVVGRLRSQVAGGVDVEGQLRQRPGCRAEDGSASLPGPTSKSDWWQGHRSWCGLLLVEADRAAGVRAHLREGHVAERAPGLASGRRDDVARRRLLADEHRLGERAADVALREDREHAAVLDVVDVHLRAVDARRGGESLCQVVAWEKLFGSGPSERISGNIATTPKTAPAAPRIFRRNVRRSTTTFPRLEKSSIIRSFSAWLGTIEWRDSENGPRGIRYLPHATMPTPSPRKPTPSEKPSQKLLAFTQ